MARPAERHRPDTPLADEPPETLAVLSAEERVEVVAPRIAHRRPERRRERRVLRAQLGVELEALARLLEPEVEVNVLAKVELAAWVVEALVEASDLPERFASQQDVARNVLVVIAASLGDVGEGRRPFGA